MSDNKERAKNAVSKLKERYPAAECSLEYGGDGYKLMVMARLSAQCTDARVNEVSRRLFERYKTAAELAEGEIGEIEEIVRPCGLYRVKARDIKEECRKLTKDHGGIVPNSVDELLTFQGIGRKIANLLVGDLYGKPAIVTDTHCIRICGRLGFYAEDMKDPVKAEKILAEVIEPCEQSDFCHRLVLFGREICTARAPRCEICPMNRECKSKSKTKKL